MKKSRIISTVLCAVLLCGCNNEQNSVDSGYVDVSEFVSEYENELENKDETDSNMFPLAEYDDKAVAVMSLNYSANGKYLYCMGAPNLRIDGDSGEVRILCSKAGCAHKSDSLDCSAYQRMPGGLSAPEGYYYTLGNQLCLFDGEAHKVLFENNFCTDFDKEMNEDNPCSLGEIVYCDGLLYIFGLSHYFTYDISKGTTSEPAVFCDRDIIMSIDTNGENIYYCTQLSNELYVYNIAAKESKKICDNSTALDYKNGALYYVQYENGVPMLYMADENGNSPKKIIEDCYVNFCVTDDCIYYQNYADPAREAFMCKIDGSDPQKIEFPQKVTTENGVDIVSKKADKDLLKIISSSAADKAYIICSGSKTTGGVVTPEEMIFAFDKGSAECKLIAETER